MTAKSIRALLFSALLAGATGCGNSAAGSAPGGACAVTGDCAAGSLCIEGVCRRVCAADTECQPEESCDQVCLPVDNPACTADDQCDSPAACEVSGGNCIGGQCRYAAAAVGAACEDGDPCTGNDLCTASGDCEGEPGQCVPCDPVDCDDGNDCTDDVCQAGTCFHADSTAGCDDGDACTDNDVCAGGTCAGVGITCDDQNPCTDDGCDPGSGCSVTPNDSNSCTDGDACTLESCQGGSCLAGGPRDCSDGNDCTDDSCDSSTGCSSVADDSNTCDDGWVCTRGESCSGGQCIYAAADGCSGSPITSGENFSCAINNVDDRVYCWGKGNGGAQGDGDNTDNMSPAPVSILSQPAVAVSASSGHVCALLVDSSVWCWGSNLFGQCGNADSGGNLMAPEQVVGLPNDVVQISVGKFFSCAVSAAGEAYCWGSRGGAVLGDGDDLGSQTAATAATLVNAEGDVEMISGGGSHACALLRTGTHRIRCWGNNNYGQLGVGDENPSPQPLTVTLANVAEVDAGEAWTCARMISGGVQCWGWNWYGTVGDGNGGAIGDDQWTPTPVSGISTAQQVQAGLGRTVCATLGNATAQCWGDGTFGTLGDNSTTDNLVPNAVSNLSNVAYVAPGWFHACAMHTNGSVSCWGIRNNGALGDGLTSPSTSLVPVSVPNFP